MDPLSLGRTKKVSENHSLQTDNILYNPMVHHVTRDIVNMHCDTPFTSPIGPSTEGKNLVYKTISPSMGSVDDEPSDKSVKRGVRHKGMAPTLRPLLFNEIVVFQGA